MQYNQEVAGFEKNISDCLPERFSIIIQDNKSYTIFVRRSHTTHQPIGVRITTKTNGLRTEAIQYDIKGSVVGANREMCVQNIIDAVQFMKHSSSFTRGVTVLQMMVAANLFDECKIRAILS